MGSCSVSIVFCLESRFYAIHGRVFYKQALGVKQKLEVLTGSLNGALLMPLFPSHTCHVSELNHKPDILSLGLLSVLQSSSLKPFLTLGVDPGACSGVQFSAVIHCMDPP